MTAASKLLYSSIRDSIAADGVDARVEVNQRALIDKILARYASANAVYRELLQNSNDAEAKTAEIYFEMSGDVVSQVVYRNNGMAFRPQDWKRLTAIAEGNPDVSKVGAFGVGAYSMFSICEEPMVISGKQALAFVWKGDALWSKVAPSNEPASEWTTFCLPSRDPYPLPDLIDFGQFLCANLTFTQCLQNIFVFVDQTKVLSMTKTQLEAPRVVQAPKATSWFKRDGAVTATPNGVFALQDIYESKQAITVSISGERATITARYVSGQAKTRIPADMAKRMERVTKKQPPPSVMVQVLLAHDSVETKPKTDAERITSSFSPQAGAGRVFIGFRTSQTTGLAAHLQAPLVPTVEREAIDLQDSALRVYNTELLHLCGMVLRLTLEHAMVQIGQTYLENKNERDKLEQKLLKEAQVKKESTEMDNAQQQVEEAPSSGSSILSFAKFMAKGVTKGIVNVLNTVVLDDGDSLLNPRDPLPLSTEERQAIVLMQSFCPRQSTPDAQVGTALAQGFSSCLPQNTPPVLTYQGVVRDTGRLPHYGMEAFYDGPLIRKLVYQNAQEYHDVLCQCRTLTMDDLLPSLGIMEREKAIRLVQWWLKYRRSEPQAAKYSTILKDAIRFRSLDDNDAVDSFQPYLYYVSDSNLLDMPLPPTVLPRDLQDGIGVRTLGALKGWFVDLPIDVWAQFISQHSCITLGQPEEEKLRVKTLSVLCKEWQRRAQPEKTVFGIAVKNLLQDKRCIPFDSSEPTRYAAERPGDLYLNSAELKAFSGLGNSFQKASHILKENGVTDEFLLLLGLRKSVSVDFLFVNLDTLRWSDDPKPLIEYLKVASLTKDDLAKLQTTQYLPAENDISRTFAPSELHLPDRDLRVFPFVKLLQWPSDDELTERTSNGKFLKTLGMRTHPELLALLKYAAEEVHDDQVRTRCLDYMAKNLGPNSAYERDIMFLQSSRRLSSIKFLPCTVRDVFVPAGQQRELQSPMHCYSEPSCLVMGFSVLDPDLDKKSGNLYGSRFNVPHEPDADLVLSQLMHLVAAAKAKLASSQGSAYKKYCQQIMKAFRSIFEYLSHRSTDFNNSSLNSIRKQQFIPCLQNDTIEWFEPDHVYFKSSSEEGGDSLTEALFHVIDFSPFLATAGVRSEATTTDIFRLLLKEPDRILKTLGSEERYRTLLRRIAANPPFKQVTTQIRRAPFLLAYKVSESEESGEEKRIYVLAKAEDIYLIDNSFFGRMFPVLRAPQESDLEAFYFSLGSNYISKKVSKSFQVIGSAQAGTPLAHQLSERLKERRPLLCSPSITSRPLVSNASKIIDSANLKIFEVYNLKAVYSLEDAVRNQRVTCCAKTIAAGKNGLYVTADFDWFDVGYAIGGLILQRCQLEDAFFIGSILEAPLDQLRSRGFPVDRILSPPVPEPALKAVRPPQPVPTVAAITADAATPQISGQQISPDVASNGHSRPQSPEGSKEVGGIDQVLLQMFPDADESFISNCLGKNPNIDKVRELAEEMAENGYPTKKGTESDNNEESFLPPDLANFDKQKKFGRRIGKALSGIRNNVGSNVSTGGRVRTVAPPPSHSVSPPNDGQSVSPEMDAAGQSNMEQMLKNAVSDSTKVNAKGLNSAETMMTQLPEGLDRHNEGCEIIPGHNLKPFNGPYRSGKTHNGIRVFSARQHASSETFLLENYHAVDSFADVLQNLCGVYQLNLSSIAIFHDPTGGTIAFNANRALHFNVRFFFSLHYNKNKQSSRDCYSYWFTTMAHELAHHLVSAHNKEHGYYTESYVTLYLPRLVQFFSQIESKQSHGGGALRSKFV